MQGHPGASKMFAVFRSKYYASDITRKIQDYTDECQMCIRTEPCSNTKLQLPFEQIRDPRNTPEDVIEIGLVAEMPALKCYTLKLTAFVFSRHPFTVPLWQPSTSTVTHVLLQNFTQKASVPDHVPTDKSFAFTAEVLE